MKKLPLTEIKRRFRRLFGRPRRKGGMPFVRLDVCCNGDQGLFTGRADAIDMELKDGGVGIRLEAHYVTEDCDFIGAPMRYVAGKRFTIAGKNYPWVDNGSGGNWCWELFLVGPNGALQIFLCPVIRHLFRWVEIDETVEHFWNATASQATHAAFLCRRGDRTRKQRRHMARQHRRKWERYVRDFEA